MILFILSIILGILLLLYILFPKILIIGNSMFPTLKDGEKVRGSRVDVILGKFEINEIYIFFQPNASEKRLNIKRLMKKEKIFSYTALKEINVFWFEGDNAENSLDSRSYGFVEQKNIVAKLKPKKGETYAKRN